MCPTVPLLIRRRVRSMSTCSHSITKAEILHQMAHAPPVRELRRRQCPQYQGLPSRLRQTALQIEAMLQTQADPGSVVLCPARTRWQVLPTESVQPRNPNSLTRPQNTAAVEDSKHLYIFFRYYYLFCLIRNVRYLHIIHNCRVSPHRYDVCRHAIAKRKSSVTRPQSRWRRCHFAW